MVLSKKYVVTLLLGWILLGGASYLFAINFIGGGAVFSYL